MKYANKAGFTGPNKTDGKTPANRGKISRFFSLVLALTVFVWCSSASATNIKSDADNKAPVLNLTYIPKYGVSGQIEGMVINKTSGLAVTAYLQVDEGGKIWGPKPTYANPSVKINDDGSFYLTFISGGYDINAVKIYILLIKDSFVPGSDYSAAEAAAIDRLIISRTADGTVTVLPREGKWAANDSAAAPQDDSKTETADTSTNETAVTSTGTGSGIMMCYSPYTNSQNPKLGDQIPVEQIQWQLNVLYPYVSTLRTFGVTGELYKLYKIAEEDYGYDIIAGCWIEAGYNETQIKNELDTLIEVANKGWCDIAVVGSECLYRGNFTQQQMIDYIKYVKNGIKDKTIPVTTSDTTAMILANAELASACDVIMATDYPFFNGVSIEKAAESLKSDYENLKKSNPNKRIIISETGWPTEGSAEGSAVPSEENAARYFHEVYNWSQTEGAEIIYFSAFDEGWKVEGAKGDIGAHWGHFTSSGVLKNAYRNYYNAINSEPVTDAVKSWAQSEILEMIKKGYISPDGPGLYDPEVRITRGDFMHYLINALSPDVTYKASETTNFTDVDPMLYYAESIGLGRNMGIIKGDGKNNCFPQKNITRQEEFTLIYRAMLELKCIQAPTAADREALSAFTDSASISDYAKDAFAALVRDGIIKGSQNTLNPGGYGTRAEAAVLIYRIYMQKQK